MKKTLVAAALALVSLAAAATCTYHTYTMNGRTVTCTTCCYGAGGGCYATCN